MHSMLSLYLKQSTTNHRHVFTFNITFLLSKQSANGQSSTVGQPTSAGSCAISHTSHKTPISRSSGYINDAKSLTDYR